MLHRTNSTVLTSRDAVAHLLNDTTGDLSWPVRLALSSAFNYLDDALPNLAPPVLPPPQEEQEFIHATGVVARIEALRVDLLSLIESTPADVDPYAVGHAAAELGTALRELTTGRPA